MKNIYQYNEILKVHRVLEEIEEFLIGIKDDKYIQKKKYIKRRIAHLRNELEITDLKDVIKELKKKKRNGAYNFVKVYLTDSEIYEASREEYEKKKRINALYEDLKKKVYESDVMNE